MRLQTAIVADVAALGKLKHCVIMSAQVCEVIKCIADTIGDI